MGIGRNIQQAIQLLSPPPISSFSLILLFSSYAQTSTEWKRKANAISQTSRPADEQMAKSSRHQHRNHHRNNKVEGIQVYINTFLPNWQREFNFHSFFWYQPVLINEIGRPLFIRRRRTGTTRPPAKNYLRGLRGPSKSQWLPIGAFGKYFSFYKKNFFFFCWVRNLRLGTQKGW